MILKNSRNKDCNFNSKKNIDYLDSSGIKY